MDLIDANSNFDGCKEQSDDIKAEIIKLLLAADDDFSEIEEYLADHEDECSDELEEFAFREAVRRGIAAYVEKNAVWIELNDEGDSSTYLDETDDDEIREILIKYGAWLPMDDESDDDLDYDDHSDARFAMESMNGSILAFAPNFQKEVFEKYKSEFELTDEKIIEILADGICDCDCDRDIACDLRCLGVEITDGSVSFKNLWGESGDSTKELLEELGWCCEFEGDSWKLETVGVYFIE